MQQEPTLQTTMSWRSLIDTSIKRSRKVRGGNYVQLATVTCEGKPSCRTVVFRGFLSHKNDLHEGIKMITDARSEKVKQIKESPFCELLYWFGKTSEQFRIAGTIQLVGADEPDDELALARKQMWGNMSDSGREQFFWHDPGQPFQGDPDPPSGGRGDDNRVLTAPESFLLMVLWPQSVKYLRLTDNYAQNDHLDSSNGWQSHRVNP